jgi:Protein of unknown function (DUF2934)
MKQRISVTHLPSQETIVEDEKAALDPDAITGKDQGKIATLAYALYEQRGREDGYDLDDWLDAEQRLVNGGEGRGF